jgi:hypothetical protein
MNPFLAKNLHFPSTAGRLLSVMHAHSDSLSTDSVTFSSDAIAGVLSRLFHSPDLQIRICALETLGNMLLETPAETHEFLVDSDFVASVLQLFPAPLKFASSLLFVLTEFVICAGKLEKPCPVEFKVIELAVGFLELKSALDFDYQMIVPALTFLVWLLWYYSDWNQRVIEIGGWERCLEVFRFAIERLSSMNLVDRGCAVQIGLQAALVIALLLDWIEVDKELASELSDLLFALWQPTELTPRTLHSLYCLRALVIRYRVLEIGRFLTGLYQLIRMTNEPILCSAFEILSLLPPDTVDLVKVVEAALMLMECAWAQKETCVTVLRALVQLADGLNSPAVLFGIDKFCPHILELIEREGFRIRTECAKLLAVMIQMLDPEYHETCRTLLLEKPVIIAALIEVLESELNDKWRLLAALHVILTKLDRDGEFQRIIAGAVSDELWDQLMSANDRALKRYAEILRRICCGFDETVE